MAALLLGLGTVAGVVGCQPQSRRQADGGVRPLQLTDMGGYVEFVSEVRRQKQESQDVANERAANETVFRENLFLETHGYSYHPNLFEFSLGGLFGLVQHRWKETATAGFEQDGRNNGTVLGFEMEGLFLQKKNYPGRVYARRAQTLEPRMFRPSVETTINEYGLDWNYISDKVPTRFQVGYTDILLDPRDTQEENGGRRDFRIRFETGYNHNKHNELSFVYQFDDVKERLFEYDVQSHEATLAHKWEFGSDRQHRLDSKLDFLSQEGSQNLRWVRWREDLRFEHFESLRSWYRFELFNRRRDSRFGLPSLRENRVYLAGTLEHRLFESLVSQLSAYGQYQDFREGVKLDRFGINGTVDYRKTNPVGILRANYRIGYDREKRTGGDAFGEVFAAAHTFIDPDPIVLRTPNIVAPTIVIFAEDNLTLYSQGSDYLVHVIGNFVEIERVPTGRIRDGETVLISYVFNVGGNFTRTTYTQNFNVRQDFNFGLAPYYRLRWQDENISPLLETGVIPEDITSHTVGAEYRWRSFRITGEYEDHDSNLRPFRAVRLSTSYSHRFFFGAQGSVRASYQDIRFDLPLDPIRDTRRTRFWAIEGRYRHPITRTLLVEGAVLYRDLDDDFSGDNNGYDVDLSLEWDIRQVQVRVTYEFAQFDSSFNKTNSQQLYVQVRRDF